MIKDIKDFPKLDAIQEYENGKAVAHMCEESIRSAEEHLERLRLELQTNPFEHEQTDIINDMIKLYVHIDICVESKATIENALKRFAPLFN